MNPSRPPSSRARILYVEDDEELREGLGEFLEDAGYEVHFASSAADGLSHLQGEHYDLVLTDYAMPPGATGASMLAHADALGLLRNTAKLMVTASDDREGTKGLTIIRKPVDVDVLLMRIEELLEDGDAESKGAPATPAKARPDDATQPVPRIALVLYVSSGSPSSARALRNLRRLLALYPAEAIELSIRDLSRAPLGENDVRVPFTPTLVKREPTPCAWVIGDLDNIKPVIDLIEDAGVEKKK